MNKKLTNIAGLLAGAFVLSHAAKSSAAEYAITIQTTPLASQLLSQNGPFTLDLQLNYGGYSATPRRSIIFHLEADPPPALLLILERRREV